ncbi:unnamed protein product, partial [Didymodactylos carnosus]
EQSSVDVLDKFIAHNCDLTIRNGDGYNCLEIAIIHKNEKFVRKLLDIPKVKKEGEEEKDIDEIKLYNVEPEWRKLLRNSQITKENGRTVVDSPMRKIIRIMPSLAYELLHKFEAEVGNKHQAFHYKYYDFEFIEDQCFVEQWKANFSM